MSKLISRSKAREEFRKRFRHISTSCGNMDCSMDECLSEKSEFDDMLTFIDTIYDSFEVAFRDHIGTNISVYPPFGADKDALKSFCGAVQRHDDYKNKEFINKLLS